MNKRRMNCKVVEPLSHFLMPDAVSAFRQIKNGRSHAFTLLELLVVIAIIGLLAVLLFPVISRSKQRVQQIQCVSNLHQLGIALQNFVADNHAYPCAFAGTNSDNPGPWFGQLERGGFGISKPITNFLAAGVFRCPSDRYSTMSYGYNVYGVLPVGDWTNALGLAGRLISTSEYFGPVRESEVVSPSEMMAIGDTFGGGVFFGRGHLDNRELAIRFARHQGSLDVVFCDAHVESPTLGFLFTNTNDAALVLWNRDDLPHRDRL